MEFDRAEQRAALTMVLLNSLSMPLMLASVNVALPAMAADLEMDAVLLSWVPSSYLVAAAALVLSFGRIADLVGRKRVFLLGTAALVITSVMAALVTTGPQLVAVRALQGASAAMLYATHVAIVSSVYPPAERGKVIGMTVSVVYIGLSGGPLLGGWLVTLFDWRAAFLVHLPLCLAALVVGVGFVPHEWRAEHRGRFDFSGAALYAASIVALMAGISMLPGATGVALVVTAALGIYVFFRHQAAQDDPLFDVTLFYTNRVFTLSCLASLIMYTATFANIVLVSLYLQFLKGLSAQHAGLLMMTQPAVMALFSPYAGRLSDRVEPRALASTGMAVTALGLVLLAMMSPATPEIAIAGALATTGFGFALFSSPNVNAIMGSVQRSMYGTASSSIATMRVIGQMSSMGLVSLAFAVIIGPIAITPEAYPALDRALTVSFGAAAALCLPGIYMSLVRGRIYAPS